MSVQKRVHWSSLPAIQKEKTQKDSFFRCKIIRTDIRDIRRTRNGREEVSGFSWKHLKFLPIQGVIASYRFDVRGLFTQRQSKHSHREHRIFQNTFRSIS